MTLFVSRAPRNPISGCTLEEEILIGRAIGGRLPWVTYISLIRRGVISPPTPKRKHRRTQKGKRNDAERAF